MIEEYKGQSGAPIIGGLILQFLGGLLWKLSGFVLIGWLFGLAATLTGLVGWLLFLTGCCGLARSKGYTPLLGLLALPLHLIGLLILVLLPNQHR